MLLERVEMWAWFNPEIWAKYFPEEIHSNYLFGIVDNFMLYWINPKNKYNIKNI
jgi:nicotinamide riboside transporter PnuC